jgi:hypothetical protein
VGVIFRYFEHLLKPTTCQPPDTGPAHVINRFKEDGLDLYRGFRSFGIESQLLPSLRSLASQAFTPCSFPTTNAAALTTSSAQLKEFRRFLLSPASDSFWTTNAQQTSSKDRAHLLSARIALTTYVHALSNHMQVALYSTAEERPHLQSLTMHEQEDAQLMLCCVIIGLKLARVLNGDKVDRVEDAYRSAGSLQLAWFVNECMELLTVCDGGGGGGASLPL